MNRHACSLGNKINCTHNLANASLSSTTHSSFNIIVLIIFVVVVIVAATVILIIIIVTIAIVDAIMWNR